MTASSASLPLPMGRGNSSQPLSEASIASAVETALRRSEPCEGATAAPGPFHLGLLGLRPAALGLDSECLHGACPEERSEERVQGGHKAAVSVCRRASE